MRSVRNIHTEFNIVELDLKDLPNLNNLYEEECGFLIIDMDELAPIPEFYKEQFINDSHTVLKLNFAGGMICKKGSITMKVNFKETTIRENEVLACRSGMYVELLDVSDDLNVTVLLYADDSFFNEMDSKQFVLFNSYLHTCGTMKLSADDMVRFIQVVNTLKLFIRTPDFIGKREVIKCFSRILIQGGYNLLIKSNFEDTRTGGSRKGIICQNFLKLLEKHYAESRKVSFYADKLCISPKHLAKMVLDGTGKHITEWIDGYVMLEAQSLLRSRKYNIQEISDKLNFANQSFFGTWFRKATGMSPSEFLSKE
ncbi:MAG: helix-turn-helix domain-containing protein [Candidatus Cryptobacteroides sp.]